MGERTAGTRLGRMEVLLRGDAVSGRRETGITQSRSISTETERCRRPIDITSRRLFLTLRTIPSKPSSGPRRTRTDWPSRRKGQGDTARPELNIAWRARISVASTGVGPLCDPTIEMTPGVVRTGNLWRGSSLQNV